MALFARRRAVDDLDVDRPPVVASGPDSLPPVRLRDWEIPAAYVVAGVVALVAVLELTVTTGTGAPKNPDVILPAVGLVLAVGQAISVRWANRLVTGILGIVAGFTLGYTKTPDSLSLVRDVGLFVPFVYGFIMTQRQSRAQRALGGPRGSRRSRGGGRSSPVAAEPTSGPRPNRRYTPPKAKVTPKEERGRRR